MQCNGGLKYYCELGASLSECLGIHLCVRRKATRRDGAFEESLPSSE